VIRIPECITGLPRAARVAIVVAHPDDETLWTGGLLLSHPEWSPFIVTLCRGKDSDRAPKFQQVMGYLGATGVMGDLDDGPEQIPLSDTCVQEAILSLLPSQPFDLLLTHAPAGEYTRHRRHEEASRAVQALWLDGKIRATSLWEFAYEDAGGSYFPKPRLDADITLPLSEAIWSRKYDLITRVYGFKRTSWEAQTTPRTEAFNYCVERNSAHSGSLSKIHR